MKPSAAEIRYVLDIVGRFKVLAEKDGLFVQRVRADCYEFEVREGKVQKGIYLYYLENPAALQGETCYDEHQKVISLTNQSQAGSIRAFLKLEMGGPDWYKDQHHLRVIGQAEPSGFYGARQAKRGEPYVVFWKLPKRARLHKCIPPFRECFVKDSRLNLLFILSSESQEWESIAHELSYEI